jgi:nucleoside-diphosphate-sugar epimerase
VKIAITGGAGTVGRAVVAAALGHHDVRIVDQRHAEDGLPVEQLTADLIDFDATVESLRGSDAIVHLAGLNNPIEHPDPSAYTVNTIASYNVLVAAAKLGISRVVQASSVNAIGAAWSANPVFDYFPIDLQHPSHVDDGYSLSKLVQELQADSITRRHRSLSVVSLRLHAVVRQRRDAVAIASRVGPRWAVHGLWGYVTGTMAADVFLRAATADTIDGHERLFVVANRTFSDTPTRQLVHNHWPAVPVRSALEGHTGLFDTTRTEELLGCSLNDEEDTCAK